jgi:Fe-S-cluster containining protein
MNRRPNRSLSVGSVLGSYHRYVAGLDDLCQRLRQAHWSHITCRPGCTDCCSHELTVFPVEAAWIRRHIEMMGTAQRKEIQKHLEEYHGSGRIEPCAFLRGGRCLVYPARPLLCRTEGFALAHQPVEGENWQVIVCPRNFQGVDLATALPQSDLINLESLNQSLVVLNHAYVNASGWKGAKRVRLSEILTTPLRLT